jgi:hypothetical protein
LKPDTEPNWMIEAQRHRRARRQPDDREPAHDLPRVRCDVERHLPRLDRMTVTGGPPVNAIPSVCGASRRFVTSADLPLRVLATRIAGR